MKTYRLNLEEINSLRYWAWNSLTLMNPHYCDDGSKDKNWYFLEFFKDRREYKLCYIDFIEIFEILLANNNISALQILVNNVSELRGNLEIHNQEFTNVESVMPTTETYESDILASSLNCTNAQNYDDDPSTGLWGYLVGLGHQVDFSIDFTFGAPSN